METPHKLGSIADILESFDSIRDRLKAFGTLLNNTLFHDGGALKSYSDGVAALLFQQLDDLEEIEDALRFEINEIKVAKLNIENVRDAAGAYGVPLRTVLEIIRFVTSADLRDRELPASALANPTMIGLMNRFGLLLDELGYDPNDPASLQRFYLDRLNADEEIFRVARILDITRDKLIAALAMIATPGAIEHAERASAAEFGLLTGIQRDAGEPRDEDGETLDAAIAAQTGAKAAEAIAQKEGVKAARRTVIAAHFKAGNDPAVIAQVLNLKKSTVERVIGQLLAGEAANPESGPERSADSKRPAAGKAVNE